MTQSDARPKANTGAKTGARTGAKTGAKTGTKTVSCDIAIIGGGPVGLTMAIALKRFAPGMEIVLVDARPLAVPKDERSTAISAGVSSVFDAIGVWAPMTKGAEPIRSMKITDSGKGDLYRPLFLGFEGHVGSGQPFAHMVPNRITAEALITAITECGVEVIAPDKVVARDISNPAKTRLTLESGTTIETALVIGADGGRSALRAMAGIDVIRHDYDQMGLVATIGHEFDHEGVAYEHFLPAGPFASLPLPDRQSSLVWTEQTKDAQALMALDEDAIAREIEQRMGSTLGKVTLKSPVQGFPLAMVLARSMVAERLALVGDAAHVVHPIAGQGLNLGLKDVAALAEVIIEAARIGEDIGAPDVLERYQRWRRFDTALMAMVTDGMNRLFSNDIAPVRIARDIGLGVVDRIGPLKKAMIGHAAGISGSDGPKLLRGIGI
jgi:2-octaprenyl-6-methoxyphenol hydroxylase